MPEKDNNTFQSATGYLLWGIGALGTIVTFVKGYRESSDLYWLGGQIVLAIGLGSLYFIIDKRNKQAFLLAGIPLSNRKLRFGLLTMLAVYAIYCGWQTAKQLSKVTIEGTVLSATKETVKTALITIPSLDKNKTYVVENGKFIIRDLTVGFFDKTVALKIKWNSLQMEKIIDVSQGSTKDVVIIFDSGPPPFRVGYTIIRDQLINLFLKGDITEDVNKYLAGATIIGNDVHKRLRVLSQQFSYKFEDYYFYIGSDDNQSHSKVLENLATKYSGKDFMRVTGEYAGQPLSVEDLKSLNFPDSGWYVAPLEYLYGYKAKVYEPSFFRYSLGVDFAKLSDEYDGLIKYITKESVPENFAITEINQPGCPNGIYLTIKTRPLGVKLAVIENISGQNLSIDGFLFRQSKLTGLRDEATYADDLEKAPKVKKKLFNTGVLAVGEKIIVPLGLVFSFPTNEIENEISKYKKINAINWANIRFPINSVWYDEDEGQYIIGVESIRPLLNRQFDPEPLRTVYYYGPAIKLDGLMIDEVPYLIREEDYANLIVRSNSEVGSCPFIFTYNQSTDTIENQGTILTGYSSKKKEAFDEIQLKTFDGRLLIKELEREVSFIDHLYLKIIDPTGNKQILVPKDARLGKVDQFYLRMEKGDVYPLNFNIPRNCIDCKYIVGAKGYYEILKNNLESRNLEAIRKPVDKSN